MTFYETRYSEKQASFLKHLGEISIVVDTVILGAREPIVDVYSCCKEAAVSGMEILAGRDQNIYFKIKVFSDCKLSGMEITLKDFVGEGYDFETGKLDLFKYDEIRGIISGGKITGLVAALLSPPHGISFEKTGRFASKEYAASETMFFLKLLKKYFTIILSIYRSADAERPRIISWSDNWSNYFDAGKEWWGTFCWTVYNPQNKTITFIAASSTD